MRRGLSGRYEVTHFNEETIRAFVPFPLPPQPPLEFSGERLKHPTGQPAISLILCQERSRLLAEYSLAGIDKPIRISTYALTRALPKDLRSALPAVEEIEAELIEAVKQKPGRTGGRKKKGDGK